MFSDTAVLTKKPRWILWHIILVASQNKIYNFHIASLYSMSLILSIDTSTRACSVALHQSGQLLGTFQLFIEKASSQVLTVGIEQLLQDTNTQLSALAAIAISKGPGSYTGLRIGTATAKGLCYALQKHLIAVNTLEAMTCEVRRFLGFQGYYFCPMIDARRMEVYCAIYNDNLDVVEPTQAKIIDENSFHEIVVNHKVVFFGDGAAKCKDKLSNKPHVLFVDNVFPLAQYVGELAWNQFQNNLFEDLETFEPFYLKEFVSTKDISK